MSRRPKVRNNRAGVGLALLFCASAALLGTGLYFATASGSRFWFDQQPGALALLGGGVALASVLLAHCVRLLLRRRAVTPVDGDA
ncbi:MAG: hypothetical protein HY054_09635 [Proteobacteria bacterium]|nr:hypothetical protein [Pseudomonadota bacterium]